MHISRLLLPIYTSACSFSFKIALALSSLVCLFCLHSNNHNFPKKKEEKRRRQVVDDYFMSACVARSSKASPKLRFYFKLSQKRLFQVLQLSFKSKVRERLRIFRIFRIFNSFSSGKKVNVVSKQSIS